MKKTKVLKAKCTGKNWYVIPTLTIGVKTYKIVDVEWNALIQRWFLRIEV